MSEINVDMRLKLAKLRQDAAEAGRIISKATTAPDVTTQRAGRYMSAQERQNFEALVARARSKVSVLPSSTPPVLQPEKEGTATGINLSNFVSMLGPASLAAAGLRVAFEGLKRAVRDTMAEYDHARRLYAKVAQSGGMASGFVINRAALSEIIGVSEEQVYQYGMAVSYLNEKLAFSTKIFNDTNPTLTATAWEFQVLKKDVQATFAVMANEAAPALQRFTKELEHLVMVANLFHVPQVAAGAAGGAMKGLLSTGLNLMLGGGVIAGMLAKYGIAVAASGGSRNDVDKAPPLPTSINRLPSSAWEKMGLVLGMGTQDPAKQTAANTKKTAENTSKLINLLLPRGQGTGGVMQLGTLNTPGYAQP